MKHFITIGCTLNVNALFEFLKSELSGEIPLGSYYFKHMRGKSISAILNAFIFTFHHIKNEC
jgi:hypothetical protein